MEKLLSVEQRLPLCSGKIYWLGIDMAPTWPHNATTCLLVVQCVVGAAVRVTLCGTVTLLLAILLEMNLLCEDSLRYCQLRLASSWWDYPFSTVSTMNIVICISIYIYQPLMNNVTKNSI